jgi:Domain of unknown function (DUF397)
MASGEHVQSDSDIADDATWRKSSWSSYNGNCVEVAPLRRARIGVRDTKDEGVGPVLVFGSDAWQAFLGCIKRGDMAL